MAFARSGAQPPLEVVYLPSALTIKEHAFRRNRHLRLVNLPRATEIGSYAFHCCDHMLHINGPEVKKIGRNVFCDCGGLISVNLPKLEAFGVACWGPNDSMRVLRLPSLTKDGDMLTLSALRFLYLPSLKTLTRECIAGNVQAIHVPKVTNVGKESFASARSLKKIDLPSVTRLAPAALVGAVLEEVTIKDKKKVRP